MNKIFKSVLIVTVLAVATRLLSFIFKIYLSRTYGADTVGLYQMCLSVLLLLLSISIGGFPTVLSRKIAECEAKCDYTRQNALLTASVLISILTSALIVAFCFLFKDYLNFLFSDERCGNLFLIMIPALLSSSIYCSIRAWLNGKKRFFAFSFTELLEEIFKIKAVEILLNIMRDISQKIDVVQIGCSTSIVTIKIQTLVVIILNVIQLSGQIGFNRIWARHRAIHLNVIDLSIINQFAKNPRFYLLEKFYLIGF